MKEAIINFINALADKYRPCEHDWELLDKSIYGSQINPKMQWFSWSYRCRKCSTFKLFENH